MRISRMGHLLFLVFLVSIALNFYFISSHPSSVEVRAQMYVKTTNETEYMLKLTQPSCQPYLQRDAETQKYLHWDYKVVPFYHCAHEAPDSAYSIVTVSSFEEERLLKLTELVDTWDAPISLGLLIHEGEEPKLESFISRNPNLVKRMDLHLAYYMYNRSFPQNLMRNVAFSNLRTKYGVFMDGDFLVPKGAKKLLGTMLHEMEHLMEKNPRRVFPINSFEVHNENTKHRPETKSELDALIDYGIAAQYQCCTQGPPIDKWRKLDYGTMGLHVIHQRDKSMSEMFFIAPNVKEFPLWDPKFVGRCWNRVSHLFELQAAEFDFRMVPDFFIFCDFERHVFKESDSVDCDRNWEYFFHGFVQAVGKRQHLASQYLIRLWREPRLWDMPNAVDHWWITTA
eukprot:Colp12_sorted_trinity150504_noHs@21904